MYKRYDSNRDVISLFSGAMGLDIGLRQAGLNVVVGQDFEPACVETMKMNGHDVLGGDIRDIQPEQLLEMTGLKVGEPFLICGGPPCQPFSTAWASASATRRAISFIAPADTLRTWRS